MPENTSYSVTLARPGSPFPARLLLLVSVLVAVLAVTAIADATAVLERPGGPAVMTSSRKPGVAAVQPGAIAPITEAASAGAGGATARSADPAPISEPQAAAAAVPAARQAEAPASSAVLSQAAPIAASPAPPGDRWVTEGFIFVIDGQEWDAASLSNVDAALSRLPASVRARLGNRALGPISILVNRSGRLLSGKQPYGGAANFFSTNDSENELVLFPGQSVLTILHELGHAFNLRNIPAGRYATVLLEPEMQSFMAATGWRPLSTADEIRSARDQMQVQMAYDGPAIWPKLSHNDPLEDFANSFALYFFAPEQLSQTSLKRFQWFERLLGR